jgi:hypothetical protein
MSKKRKMTDAEYGPRPEVEKIVKNLPEHPTQLRRWIENGFPPPIKLGYRTQVWHLPSVRAYMEARKAEAAAKAAAKKMLRDKAGRHA